MLAAHEVRTLGTMDEAGPDPARVAAFVAVAAIAAFGAWGLWGSSGLEYNDNFYAPWQWTIGASAFVVGSATAWRAPRHPMGWVLLAAAASVWCTAGGSAILGRSAPTWYTRPLMMAAVAGWVLARGLILAAAPLVYPNGVGRSVSRRVFVGLIAASIVAVAVAQSVGYGTWDFAKNEPAAWAEPWRNSLPWLFRIAFAATVLANVELIARVIRSDREERRRHAVMAVFAVVLAVPGVVDLANVAGWHLPGEFGEIEFWAETALPLVLAYGILRQRTLGFEVVIRRSVVYAATALIAAALYALVVVAFAAVLTEGRGVGAIVATGAVALAIHPVHLAVERFARRRLFGDRDDPYRALARLGGRLAEPTLRPDALPLVAESIRDSLRLPFVAVDLRLEDGTVVRAAESGSRPATLFEFPIVHGGLEVGALHVGARSEREALTPDENDLVGDLARAAGPVARAAQLIAELQRSRETLVLAREEERRRLRRDLHDGVGPTLASVALGIEAAMGRLANDTELVPLLEALDVELQHTINELREIVHGLRPPALDDLGLIPALNQHAANLTARSDTGIVSISVSAAGDLGSLPAAVEVAAFRITLEAMTNVVRHAAATKCTVMLDAGDGLEIVVADDGAGLDGSRHGVGMSSMRERAEELGGRVVFESRVPRGTAVRAWLPLVGALR